VTAVLVHLAAGVGNVVLATPLLVALHEMGMEVHVLLDADYEQTADLLRPWGVVASVRRGRDWRSLAHRADVYDIAVPAVPPFYRPCFRREYRAARVVARPQARLFYQNEQRWYLAFARALGWAGRDDPACSLPIAPRADGAVGLGTLVLAPGCKTGEMAAKRWPYFTALAERFEDVAVVGTPDDDCVNGEPLCWPAHVRSFVGALTLRETAELMAAAGAVVANDSGLAHVAVAVGTPTLLLFGPTPDATLGTLPPNASVLRQGLMCEPCWFGARFAYCGGRVDCLRGLHVANVEAATRALLGASL
jgi:ADP-heptose:LPS heptosyltransferase